MKPFFFLLALLLPVTGITDSIYKWIDSEGVIHFSTTPPRDQEKTVVMAKLKPQKLSDNANKMTETSEDREKISDHQKIETTPQESQRKSEEQIAYCNALKGNIAMLKSSPRIRVKRSDGEYEILDDGGRDKEVSRIQKLMNEFCKS